MKNRYDSSYSALGYIRRLCIFDTREYTLQPSADPFQKIRERYKPMVTSFNRSNRYGGPVVIEVFFRLNPRQLQKLKNNRGLPAAPVPYEKDSIVCIPVNFNECWEEKKVSIPSMWTQDMFEITHDGKLHYDRKVMSAGLADLLKRHFLVRDDRPAGQLFGGNQLRGKTSHGDFLLTGENEPVKTANIFAVGDGTKKVNSLVVQGVAAGRIFSVDVGLADEADSGENKRFFYHADMYCTLAGPDQEGKEILLVADPVEGGKVKTQLDLLAARFSGRIKGSIVDPCDSQGRSIPGDIRFSLVRLPLYLLRDENGKLLYALSYNNCIVENYEKAGGGRILTFYFPDYTETVKRYIAGGLERYNRLLERIYPEVNPARVTGPGPIVSPAITRFFRAVLGRLTGAAKPESSIMMYSLSPEGSMFAPMSRLDLDKLMSGLQDKIKDIILTALPSGDKFKVNVSFVSFPFHHYARRHGSLHCMAKVVKRD